MRDCWVPVAHRYFQNQFAGAVEPCIWRNPAQEELDEDIILCVVSFYLISSGAQLGSIGDLCSFWGSLLLFWFHSRTLFVFGWCNALFMYLCEVAIVSQLCISVPYVLHGLCEDYLTCDIAFNAVMPLSRASTHGRYSRIEGVRAYDATQLRRSSMKILSFVLFRSIWSVVEPSWGRSGICVAFGVVFFYFGSIVGPCLYLDDVMLYSCICVKWRL